MTDATDAADSLLSAHAVRERAHEMLAAAENDKLANFTLHPDKLDYAADVVAQVIRDNYPSLQVPLHARWRHFRLAGVDLWPQLAAARQWDDAGAQARAAFDLAIVSVLLDAGAGPDWRYRDGITGLQVARSEGLAIASLRMFEAGYFSADPADPLRADASELAAFTAEDLARGFQVSDHNPLTGLEGRAALIARLGQNALDNPAVFAVNDAARPGGLFDHLVFAAAGKPLPAPDTVDLGLEDLRKMGQRPPAPIVLLFSMAEGTTKRLAGPDDRGVADPAPALAQRAAGRGGAAQHAMRIQHHTAHRAGGNLAPVGHGGRLVVGLGIGDFLDGVRARNVGGARARDQHVRGLVHDQTRCGDGRDEPFQRRHRAGLARGAFHDRGVKLVAAGRVG